MLFRYGLLQSMTGHILNHVDIPTWLHDRACPAVQGSKEQKSAARKTAIQQLVFDELATGPSFASKGCLFSSPYATTNRGQLRSNIRIRFIRSTEYGYMI